MSAPRDALAEPRAEGRDGARVSGGRRVVTRISCTLEEAEK